MSRRLKIALVMMLPVLALGAIFALGGTSAGLSARPDYVVRVELPPAGGAVGLPRVYGPPDASRPLVVLDPGHGGHDPGAGTGAMNEKALTLGLALALRDELLRQGGVRVALTREDDRFLVLTERSGIARRLKADLFLSIHADSVEGGGVRGASVYTLSDRGSNEAAARIAMRENRADVVNGVALADTSDVVRSILVDLAQDETRTRSHDFATLILRELAGRLRLRDDAVQSAAFVVLKAPDMPSVLLESGYISNSEDASLLASPEGRKQFAEATARAVRIYFAKQAR